jgi:tRNA threonylcarbamoyladenosine biosynthesis protein TsaE
MRRQTLRWQTVSAQETEALGRALGAWLKAGDVVGLEGDLGAGKTCLARGVARGFGVPESIPVCSPTFVIANLYEGRFLLHHLDLYRLSDVEELEAMGYRDALDPYGAMLVEWPSRIPGCLPPSHVLLALSGVADTRSIEATPSGIDPDRWEELARATARWRVE